MPAWKETAVQETKMEIRLKKGLTIQRKSQLTIAVAAAALAVLGSAVLYAQDHAQDKYL